MHGLILANGISDVEIKDSPTSGARYENVSSLSPPSGAPALDPASPSAPPASTPTDDKNTSFDGNGAGEGIKTNGISSMSSNHNTSTNSVENSIEIPQGLIINCY